MISHLFLLRVLRGLKRQQPVLCVVSQMKLRKFLRPHDVPRNKKKSYGINAWSRRRYEHYLSKCEFLPDSDRQFLYSKIRQTSEHIELCSEDEGSEEKKTFLITYDQIDVSA